MPTLKLEKPKEYYNETTPVLKFNKVRVGKTVTLPIVL
jgi:hydrocephalus-inducing protein